MKLRVELPGGPARGYLCENYGGALALIERILHDACAATGAAEEEVWVSMCDVPADNIAEYGRILPAPGGRAA